MKLRSLMREFKEPRQLFMKAVHRYPELFKWMDDELYLRFFYRIVMGKKLNLDNPQTFNEKLQWLKLHDRKDIYTIMVDKYEAKQYVAEQIGEKYIIPTLGVWDSFDDIDFDSLPDQFVLKCTHDSGGLVICRDKSRFDKNSARKKINRSLRNNFFWFGREWPYKNVKPRIIAEKYMENTRDSDLKDYKFFCFGGMAKCYKVDFDRFKEHHANYFDMDGELLRFGEQVCPPVFNRKLDVPQNMETMNQFAEKLSSERSFLRVDFYDVNGEVYFGELTFFSASGFGQFISDEWDQRLGEWIPLGGGYILKTNEMVVRFLQNGKVKKLESESQKQNDGLLDYKFFCFNGTPQYLYVSENLGCHERAKVSFMTMDYKETGFSRKDYSPFKVLPSKPVCFEEMKALASKLSKGIPFLRVDFYEIREQVFFGELTFFSGSGFTPYAPSTADLELGKILLLPEQQ